MEPDFSIVTGFQWDSGNLTKSAGRHGVSPEEAEEVFFRAPWIINDTRLEDNEPRWAAIGQSERGRALRVLFTLRTGKIRPISCRPASRKERKAYEKALRERR
jgi:uncharacterized DUF497 family protein